MQINPEPLWEELRTLVADLGKNGGLISPSVYDTAQVLRLAPPDEGVEAGLQWLLDQQQPDGGWGSPDAPYTRTVPTLAAILTLHTYRDLCKTRVAVEAGRGFLAEHAGLWADFTELDLLPVAAEMILPYLLEEANAAGLKIDRAPYAPVYALRQQKCQQISRWQLKPGTPPTHSWEALNLALDPNLLDRSGGIGHNSAATAAWLRQAKRLPGLATACSRAQQYLTKAAAATGVNVPGVVPHIWPITGFEISYSLYALLTMGLISHPLLQAPLQRPLQQLKAMIQCEQGINFGDYFIVETDCTSTGVAALQASGNKVDPQVVLQFKSGNHFRTYDYELNASALSTTHALYALAQVGQRYPAVEQFLVERQCADGRWRSDKWHASWIYTTLEVLHTLTYLGYSDEVMKSGTLLIQAQGADGSWGSGNTASRLETGYAMIALQALQKAGLLNGPGIQALQRGSDWLCYHYRSASPTDELMWLGKELYSPYRIDRLYELAVILMLSQERIAV